MAGRNLAAISPTPNDEAEFLRFMRRNRVRLLEWRTPCKSKFQNQQ